MSIVDDDYQDMHFSKASNRTIDPMKRYRSESHRDFFESKFSQNNFKPGVDLVISDTLTRLQSKLKHNIV